jgi:hypothetical protein
MWHEMKTIAWRQQLVSAKKARRESSVAKVVMAEVMAAENMPTGYQRNQPKAANIGVAWRSGIAHKAAASSVIAKASGRISGSNNINSSQSSQRIIAYPGAHVIIMAAAGGKCSAMAAACGESLASKAIMRSVSRRERKASAKLWRRNLAESARKASKAISVCRQYGWWHRNQLAKTGSQQLKLLSASAIRSKNNGGGVSAAVKEENQRNGMAWHGGA